MEVKETHCRDVVRMPLKPAIPIGGSSIGVGGHRVGSCVDEVSKEE
jgi:hypothetical protein